MVKHQRGRKLASKLLFFKKKKRSVVRRPRPDKSVCPVHPGRLAGFPLTQSEGQDACKTVYFDAGEGEAVVFIHGLGGNLTHWQFVAPELSEDYRVLGLDLPGFGASLRPKGKYTFEGMARSTFDLLDRRGVDRVTVVGHSFGGAVATTMALLEPQRVAGLVAINPPGYQRFPWWMRAGSHVALHPAVTMPGLCLSVRFILSQVCRTSGPGVDAFARSATRLKGGYRFLDDLTHAAWSMRKDLVETNFLDRLGDIRQPAHLIWGEDDHLLSAPAGLRAARKMPACETTGLPGVGHMPNFEAPETVVNAVRDVLSRAQAWRDLQREAQPARTATAGRRRRHTGNYVI